MNSLSIGVSRMASVIVSYAPRSYKLMSDIDIAGISLERLQP